MLQFNLLPDVKKEYIKAKRQKHVIFSVSLISAGAALGVVLILFSYVQFAQKKSINDLSKDIDSEIASLESINDLDKILTIQSQLETLPGLHTQKPESSRIFTYLTQLTPADVKISMVNIDFVESTMTIEGRAPSLASINRFADTLKFSKFKSVEKVDGSGNKISDTEKADINQAEEQIPFTAVQAELSRNEDSASYTIKFTFEPTLFNNTQEVVLIIPEIVTTRSTLGKPEISDQVDNPLFEDNGGDQ